MLRTLWDAGVVPDLLVGGSVGAINACFVGSHPEPRALDDLADLWLGMDEETLCGRRRGVVVNVFRRRPYLFSSDRLRRMVSEWVPTYHLENLPIPVRVATTDLVTGRAVHHDHGYIPDVLAASAALPAIFPPVVLNGPHGPQTHVDAGVAENVPLSGALDLARPGDRVWVLDVTRAPATTRRLRNPLDVLIASLSASVRNREEPILPDRRRGRALQAGRVPTTAAPSSTSPTPTSCSGSGTRPPGRPSSRPPGGRRSPPDQHPGRGPSPRGRGSPAPLGGPVRRA